MTGRGLMATIFDALAGDLCLPEYLDTRAETTHGTDDWCDQPTNRHHNPSIRREQMGWPADFHRAVITIGRLGRTPFQPSRRAPWIEDWTFVVNIFARETIRRDDGTVAGSGDLWALDIYDQVVRILGWSTEKLECGGDFLVARRQHDGNIIDLSFVEKDRNWQIASRFRWTVISRGLVAPVSPCCQTAIEEAV